MLEKLTAAVIGLGAIGQGYDYDLVGGNVILTHATGYANHKGYNLLAGVDRDICQRKRFRDKFSRPAYKDVETLFRKHRPDIVSIATPTSHHFSAFKEIITHRPLAVICEKPIASNVAEAEEMVALAKDNACTLLVNYLRRFDPAVIQLKNMLQNGVIGDIFKIQVWYSKGLQNNGSHYIDLLRFFFGNFCQISVIDRGRQWGNDDVEPDMVMYIDNCPVYFLAAREECFTIGEIIILGTGGMIRYAERGNVIEIRKARSDPFLKGYRHLQKRKIRLNPELRRSFWHVLEALYRHLSKNVPLQSDGNTAVETLSIVENCCQLLGSKS